MMDATETLQYLVHMIQKSNLNFKIELSPFSAKIVLKNTFITDKNGNRQMPCRHAEVDQFLAQEDVIKKLRVDLEQSANDCEETYQIKENLEKQLEIMNNKLAQAEKRIQNIKKETNNNDNATKDLKQEVTELKIQNKTQRQIAVKLRNEVNETKSEALKKTSDLKKEYKSEIKSWRKDLGDKT